MKKLMIRFAENALSRSQMKAVTGGGYCICSSGGPSTPGYPSSGTCGSSVGDDSQYAQQMAQSLNSGNDGYTYTVVTC